MSDLTLHGNIISPPSRTVSAFLKLSNIRHTFKEIKILEGEHLSDQYTQINPYQSVPAITHNGFTVWESAAVITYLADAFNVNNSWYPKDPKVRCRINSYFHYHHQGVREKVLNYFMPKVIAPMRGGPRLTEAQEAPLRVNFNSFLDEFKWLISETGYVARTPGMTIADVFAFNEFIASRMVLFNIDAHPEIRTWYERVGANPVVREITDQVNQMLIKIMEGLGLIS